MLRRRALTQMIANGHAENVFMITVSADKSYGNVVFPNDPEIFNNNDNCFYICLSDTTNLIVILNRKKNGNWDSMYCISSDSFLSHSNYSREDLFAKSYSSGVYGITVDFFVYKISKEN